MSGPPPETTQHNIDKVNTSNARMEIKILDPAGNRTQAAGLEGRDSNDQTNGHTRLLVEYSV